MGDPRTFWVEDPVEDDDDEVEQPWEPDDPEYRNAASYVQKVVFCTHICKQTARECKVRQRREAEPLPERSERRETEFSAKRRKGEKRGTREPRLAPRKGNGAAHALLAFWRHGMSSWQITAIGGAA